MRASLLHEYYVLPGDAVVASLSPTVLELDAGHKVTDCAENVPAMHNAPDATTPDNPPQGIISRTCGGRHRLHGRWQDANGNGEGRSQSAAGPPSFLADVPVAHMVVTQRAKSPLLQVLA